MSHPRVWAFAHCRNEAAMLPYFLRYYAAFCDQIHIFDDGSTDGSQDIVKAHPKATLHPLQMDGLDEDALLALANEKYPMARGKADWIMWPDIDEFVWHPKILDCLALFRKKGYVICRTLGFNMGGKELPADDGVSQLTDIYRTGWRAPVYSKPIVIDPDKHVAWSRGKHTAQETGHLVSPWENEYAPHPWRLRLLHYRFLTPRYARERNDRQYARSTNKDAAWTCRPGYVGEHSPEWVGATMRFARDVVCDEACYLQPGADA